MVSARTLVGTLAHDTFPSFADVCPLGETPTSADCFTAVSIFSVDYDAPERLARPIQHRLRNSIRSTQF